METALIFLRSFEIGSNLVEAWVMNFSVLIRVKIFITSIASLFVQRHIRIGDGSILPFRCMQYLDTFASHPYVEEIDQAFRF